MCSASTKESFRPVSLMLHVMNMLERLGWLPLRVKPSPNMLRFAYRPVMGVVDAVIYLLQHTHFHLNGNSGIVRYLSTVHNIIHFCRVRSCLGWVSPLLLLPGWSVRSYLLNIGKTKEMGVVFWRTKTATGPMSITGEEVETNNSYMYLGIHLLDRLNWRTNSDAVYKKGRLYFPRTLRSFNVCSEMLEIFYCASLSLDSLLKGSFSFSLLPSASS